MYNKYEQLASDILSKEGVLKQLEESIEVRREELDEMEVKYSKRIAVSKREIAEVAVC